MRAMTGLIALRLGLGQLNSSLGLTGVCGANGSSPFGWGDKGTLRRTAIGHGK
jgi:hypothetical protein